MKTTIKHHFTTKFYRTLLTAYAVILLSFIAAVNADLSGTWVLNPSKSDFGDSPIFVLPKRLEITNNKAILRIHYGSVTNAGADTAFTVPFLPGEPLKTVTADQRTRHYQIAWAENGRQLQIEYSSSFSSKPNVEEYHTIEHYRLSADGKELILDKQVKVYDGETYAVKGVYDKM
jgi:hypothetical protein